MISIPKRLLGRFRHNGDGVVVIELAFVIPALLIAFLGATELGYYVYLNMKLQNTATGVADVATRDEVLTQASVGDLYWAAANFAAPFDLTQNGVVFVSGVGVDTSGDPVVLWQEQSAGPFVPESAVGAAGEGAVLPQGLVLTEGDTAIVTEVFYQYQPWLGALIDESIISKSAFYRPRLGALDGLAGGT